METRGLRADLPLKIKVWYNDPDVLSTEYSTNLPIMSISEDLLVYFTLSGRSN